MTIFEFNKRFPTEESAIDFIIETKYKNGYVCPNCGCIHNIYRSNVKSRNFYCNNCNSHFSALAGTIFENTHLDLRMWLYAINLVMVARKGISACQLQKIRNLYPQSDSEAFEGTVECDEVYIGGKEKWKHKSMRTPHTQGRSTKTKTHVFGMMERSTIINANGEVENITNVHAFVVENTNKATLQPIIQQFVVEGSRIITDELNAYNGLSEKGYIHAIVNHGAKEYANGDVFTNSIEGF